MKYADMKAIKVVEVILDENEKSDRCLTIAGKISVGATVNKVVLLLKADDKKTFEIMVGMDVVESIINKDDFCSNVYDMDSYYNVKVCAFTSCGGSYYVSIKDYDLKVSDDEVIDTFKNECIKLHLIDAK